VKYVVSIARFFYALVFLLMVLNHFSQALHERGYAVITFVEPFLGILAIWSALTIMVGFKARWSAWFMTFFIIYDLLTNLFLKEESVNVQSILTVSLALLSCSLLIAYFGAGPLSIDYENKIRSKRFRRYQKDARNIREQILVTPTEL
jgi:putative oxidoreductase